jgi:hypothetical protein
MLRNKGTKLFLYPNFYSLGTSSTLLADHNYALPCQSPPALLVSSAPTVICLPCQTPSIPLVGPAPAATSLPSNSFLQKSLSLAGEFIEESLKESSKSRYHSGWQRWLQYCSLASVQPIPAEPAHVAGGLAWVASEKVSISAVEAVSAAISYKHRCYFLQTSIPWAAQPHRRSGHHAADALCPPPLWQTQNKPRGR